MTQVNPVPEQRYPVRVLKLALTALAALGLFHGLLWWQQERMTYFPRRYPFDLDRVPAPIEVLRFDSAGAQTAFYIPPRGLPRDAPPPRLWLLFGGNAMTALDWADWALRHPDAEAAFLLIDYPGYGASSGKPSQRTIASVSDAAFVALAARLAETTDALAPRTFMLGHSLGAAVALEFACRWPVAGVVLTAPFTTIGDVAASMLGPQVRPLLRDDYDNVARLAELKPRGIPVTVLHGTDDEVIAFGFGERLAASAPWVRFEPIDRGRHNDLYDVAGRQVRTAMLEVSGRPR
jgi:pimeloyl-ACP methyl ester carboxylesterase